MEALQMLKYALKKRRLDFMTRWITAENDMIEKRDLGDSDLLAQLVDFGDNGSVSTIDDAIDKAIRIVCQSDDEAA
jgi:hypothetical protein